MDILFFEHGGKASLEFFGATGIYSNWDACNFTLIESASVPEPATILLFATGLVGLAGISRKKFLKK